MSKKINTNGNYKIEKNDEYCFVHENNILKKIKDNYRKKGSELNTFYNDKYKTFKKEINSLHFTIENEENFRKAAKIFEKYMADLEKFASTNEIKSQSKFSSSFLEEMSFHLFKDLEEIKSNELEFKNKKIFSGLRFNSDLNLEILTKDVDFCIGKKMSIKLGNEKPIEVFLPIVTVEKKTYIDSTMFGEVKSSNRNLKNAVLNCKTFLLVGYVNMDVKNLHSIKYEAFLNGIFVLKKDQNDKKIDEMTLFRYWEEVKKSIKDFKTEKRIEFPGVILWND
ncbi:Bpu10I family restriction endonuclease [Mycoplasma procyoni]|uniref:Bpu10I family restriction endonuclease n=1 Tax=Mycoplasma procyoni TaxID=568784 RepID=UPI00197B772C|nr:Bpu10I family restriction endonuclease [Mycoplasma procyoni]MBN3535001.1 Bpu10I family restriction endonuclease [Mycoplasma procyoni]